MISAQADVAGTITCSVAAPGSFVDDAAATPVACAPGTFSVGAKTSCQVCAVGKYQPNYAETQCLAAPPGRFVDKPGSSASQTCAPGTYSLGSSTTCRNCSAGTYTPFSEASSCELAEPGHYVSENGATTQTPCSRGTFSGGSGASNCSVCLAGSLQSNVAQSACILAAPGQFVNSIGANTSKACPPGEYSGGGAEECTPCDVGSFNALEGAASCKACPATMTTTRTGQTYCDACIRSYFFNSLLFETEFDSSLLEDGNQQCVQCCERCEDLCDVDDEDCVRCDADGADLAALDVKRGWWRATGTSLKIYQCPFDRACRGGTSTTVRSQCFDGHYGALCGACRRDYNYEVTSNRCRRCSGLLASVARLGNICILLLCLLSILILLLYALAPVYGVDRWSSPRHLVRGAWHWATTYVDDVRPVVDNSNNITTNLDEQSRRARRQKLIKSIRTKMKLIIAAWQIGSSTQSVFIWQVRWPPIFDLVTHMFGVFGFALFDVGSFKCLFAWSFFDKLLFVTIAPFGVVALGTGIYCGIQRGKLKTEADRRRVFSNVTYASLLFIYIILPSIATTVLTYFSCARFDRGDENDLRVIGVELSIKCTSKRYRRWAIYDALMIVMWPVGVTLGIGVLLWRNRSKLNPKLPDPQNNQPQTPAEHRRDLAERRHAKVMDELAKLELRDKDESLTGLEFLFEDYKCRSYLFPIFELARRLVLSSVLAIFYPGSMQQVVVGLLGAMLSYVIYSYMEAFIEEDDDIVSKVAQGELVLIYFAALAVYISDTADQKREVFQGDLFGLLLVAVFFASFFVAIYLILLDLFGYAALLNVVHQAQLVAHRRFSHHPPTAPTDQKGDEIKDPDPQDATRGVELVQNRHDANIV